MTVHTLRLLQKTFAGWKYHSHNGRNCDWGSQLPEISRETDPVTTYKELKISLR